ncbi:MAG: VanZ family protein [Nitrospira sp.]|nr:VanZ family protein [Nitrospira sp.]
MVSSEIRTEPLVSPVSILRYWGPVCSYAGLIFFGSSVSNPPESVSSLLGNISDKILHLCEYGVLGALAFRACRHGAGAWGARHAVIVAVAGCALYGLSDEIHQLFVPLRQGDPLDLVADSLGATLGAWTWRLTERRAVPSPL